MVECARAVCAGRAIPPKIRTGVNTELPFEDGAFDLLLSVNVIHYDDDGYGLEAALIVYPRVLRPEGHALIVSVGAERFICHTAERVGLNHYRLTYNDFRKDQIIACFENAVYLEQCFGCAFPRVVTGRNTERHPTASRDFFYALAER